MPIKDKINSELKNRFSQEIRKTAESDKERGFLICADKGGILSATKSCEGEQCTVALSSLKAQCPFKIQGNFHTHPHATEAKEYAEGKLGRKVSLEDAKKVVIGIAKEKNISLTEPSYKDVLGEIISRYMNITLGTTCIGTDIEPEKVECWTTKSKIKEEDFDIAFRELNGPDINKSPLKWTRLLFEKEIIDLKSSNKIDRNR